MRLRTTLHAGLALSVLVVASVGSAQPKAPAGRAVLPADGTVLDASAQAALTPALDVRTLPDGLRVVLDPRPGTGTVTFCAAYDVGTASETESEAGFTRLAAAWLSNLDGAERVVTERGGVVTTTVELDRTTFCTTLPAHELALGAWAEARRTLPWELTPARLEVARARAEADLRAPAVGAPLARGRERVEALALRGALRFERTALDSVRTFEVERRAELQRFVRAEFQPDRCVLAVSGDLEPGAVIAALGAALPPSPARTPAPRSAGLGAPVRQLGERFSALREEALATPLVFLAWVTPALGTSDNATLELTAALLAGGPGTLLHDELVVRSGLARSVRAYTTENRGVGLFVIEVELTSKAPQLAVETTVAGALRRLAVGGPTLDALARARAARLTALLHHLDGGPERALELATRELGAAEQSPLEGEPGRYRAVTPADVRRVAAARLTDTGRTVVELYPPGWATGGAARAERLHHIVEPGDTLGEIAARYGVTIEAITKENSIQRAAPIRPGQTLRLPAGAKDSQAKPGPGAKKGAATSTRAPLRTYTVRKGDTLSGIAHRHRVTTTALARANGLDPKRSLRIGQTLTVPSPPAATAPGKGRGRDAEKGGKSSGAAPTSSAPTERRGARAADAGKGPAKPPAKPAPAPASARSEGSGAASGAPTEKTSRTTGGAPAPAAQARPSGAHRPDPKAADGKANAAAAPRVHVVAQGETLSGIAHRYGVSTAALAARNGLDPKKPIRPGQRLVVPE